MAKTIRNAGLISTWARGSRSCTFPLHCISSRSMSQTERWAGPCIFYLKWNPGLFGHCVLTLFGLGVGVGGGGWGVGAFDARANFE